MKERVDQLRGIEIKPALVDLAMPLVIPVDYVPQTDLRIGLYRRLLSPLSAQEYEEMQAELLDRYGPLPEQVQGLLDAALVRGEGGALGIEKLRVSEAFVALEGPLGEDIFSPPRWIVKNGARLGAGGVNGLHAAAGELMKKAVPRP